MKVKYILRLKEAFIDSFANTSLSYVFMKMLLAFLIVGLVMYIMYLSSILDYSKERKESKEERKG